MGTAELVPPKVVAPKGHSAVGAMSIGTIKASSIAKTIEGTPPRENWI